MNPGDLKDHEIAALVNDLRDLAIEFAGSQQLRQRIHARLLPDIRRIQNHYQGVLADAQEHFEMGPHPNCICAFCQRAGS